MKKVLLFVFMLLITIPVKGLENDLNTIRKYKYYRLNEVLGPMVLKNEINEEYPFIDEENYILGDLSDLSSVRPTEDGRKIYEYDGFYYLEKPKVNTLIIEAQHESILYDIEIKTNDGNTLYKSDDIINNTSKTYKLNENIDMKDLIIKCKGADNKKKWLFTIYFKFDDKLVGEIGVNSFLNDIEISGNQVEIKDNSYNDVYSLTELELTDNLIYKGPIKLYQYQDYKYQSYKFVREYYDEYLTGPFEDYIYCDETDYIDVPIDKTDNVIEDIETYEPEVLPSNEIMPVTLSNKNNVNNNVSKNLPEKSNKILETASPNENTSPIQYAQTLKFNKNTSSNKVKNNNIYYYSLLIILIILLIITFKIKNKLKKYQR